MKMNTSPVVIYGILAVLATLIALATLADAAKNPGSGCTSGGFAVAAGLCILAIAITKAGQRK